MYNKPITTIDGVKLTIQTAYSEHDWLLIVLKSNGWADNIYKYSPKMTATVGLVKINELHIIAHLEHVEVTPALHRPKITVDFRIPNYAGEYSTVVSIKYPTEEDIRWQLVKLTEYTGFTVVAPIAPTL